MSRHLRLQRTMRHPQRQTRRWRNRAGRQLRRELRENVRYATWTARVLPDGGEWNSAVAHSLAYPTHILGPYDDADGVIHMYCDGSGDPNEPSNCDFTTAAVR